MNDPFMTNKSEGSHAWFEVPHHDGSVSRARDDLLEVRVEGNFVNSILVALERSLKGWIARWLLLIECLRHFEFQIR